MGQKVHPYILRIGFGKDWLSRWFTNSKREFAQNLEEDIKIRNIVKKSYPLGFISSIIIERISSYIKVTIYTSHPGMVIGRRGQERDKVRSEIEKATGKKVRLDTKEVLEPSLDAQLVAEMICFQIIKRVNYRKAVKRALQQAQSLGCEGMKIRVGGRLEGAEIARSEIYKYGKVPLQTFRSDIDYGFSVAKTTYGTIGVKVWIYKGEKYPGDYLKYITGEEKRDKSER